MKKMIAVLSVASAMGLSSAWAQCCAPKGPAAPGDCAKGAAVCCAQCKCNPCECKAGNKDCSAADKKDCAKDSKKDCPKAK